MLAAQLSSCCYVSLNIIVGYLAIQLLALLFCCLLLADLYELLAGAVSCCFVFVCWVLLLLLTSLLLAFVNLVH
jgi:hypothetical protein